MVSTHEGPGWNIPSDPHQEHLNRIVKDAIRGFNTNKTEKAVQKVGKALRMLSPLLDNFDSINNVKQPSGSHKAPSFAKDLEIIVKRDMTFSAIIKTEHTEHSLIHATHFTH